MQRTSEESRLVAQLLNENSNTRTGGGGRGTLQTSGAGANNDASDTESVDGGSGTTAQQRAPKDTKDPNEVFGRGKVKKKGAKVTEKGPAGKAIELLQTVLLFLCKPLLMLLERRLNFYGKLTWHEVEYLLWREGNTDGSYIVSESIKHPSYYELAVCLRGKSKSKLI